MRAHLRISDDVWYPHEQEPKIAVVATKTIHFGLKTLKIIFTFILQYNEPNAYLLNDRLLKRMCHNLQSAQICSKEMVSNCNRIVPFRLDWQFCTTILVILFGSMFRSLSSLVAWLLPFSVLIYRVLCSESIDLMPGSTRLSSYYDYYYFYSPFNFLSRQGRRRRRITPNSILKVSQKWACD